MREFTEQELVRRAKAEEIRSLGRDMVNYKFIFVKMLLEKKIMTYLKSLILEI